MKIKKEMNQKREISILTIAVAAILVISTGIVLADKFSGGYITGLFFIQGATDDLIGPYGADFGDAPDSTNHNNTPAYYPSSQVRQNMTAYPLGGPPGIIAEFATTYEPDANGGSGPCHHNTTNQSTHCVNLGINISYEYNDSDLLPDSDWLPYPENIYIPNINVTEDSPDQDFYDDGLIFDALNKQLNMTNCTLYNFTFEVTLDCNPGVNFTFNAWFDWNRDGDWNDNMTCSSPNDAPEWAVRNQTLPLTNYIAPQTIIFTSNSFLPFNPAGEPLWMRMTLEPGNTTKMNYNGTGPGYCFTDGETEDYYIQLCQDNDQDGFAGNTLLNCGAFDCDDNDAEVYPGAKEICDGKDNDCDGLTDEVLHEPCNDMVSYWRLDDLLTAVAPRLTKSSTCLYSIDTKRFEGIGRPATGGIWQADIDFWENNPSVLAEDKFDIEPEPNIYHAGGEICYVDHALKGTSSLYNPPPPIVVYGNLSGAKVQPDLFITPKKYISFGDCEYFGHGYYAIRDTLANWGSRPYEKDCSNPPFGRPQFTISYVGTLISDFTAMDYVNGNNAELIAGNVGVENCTWPGCWDSVALYCPPWSYPFVKCSCPPSETAWMVYAYDPLEVPSVSCNPNWGNCPVIVCAPCAPNCIIAGNTLPPQWTNGRDSGSSNVSCGAALDFEGDGDYLEAELVGNIPAANESQTIGIWYKIENDSAVLGSSTYRTLITLYNETNGSAVSIVINQNDLGVRKYDGTFLVKTSSLPPVGSWIFVAYIYDQDTGIHRLYINETEADNSNAAPNTAIPEKMRIGKNSTETTVSFDGTIDDIAIWDIAFTGTIVADKYDNVCTYCGTDQLCHEATMVLWDETDERSLPYVNPPKFPGQDVKSFTNYTLTYPD